MVKFSHRLRSSLSSEIPSFISPLTEAVRGFSSGGPSTTQNTLPVVERMPFGNFDYFPSEIFPSFSSRVEIHRTIALRRTRNLFSRVRSTRERFPAATEPPVDLLRNFLLIIFRSSIGTILENERDKENRRLHDFTLNCDP